MKPNEVDDLHERISTFHRNAREAAQEIRAQGIPQASAYSLATDIVRMICFEAEFRKTFGDRYGQVLADRAKSLAISLELPQEAKLWA
jgi:hypothetical protein